MLKKELEAKLLASEEANQKLTTQNKRLLSKLKKSEEKSQELARQVNENLILSQSVKRLREGEKKFEEGIKDFCSLPWYKKIFYTDEDVFTLIKNIESK